MQLRHYASVLLRWLWLILLGTCICAGATYIVSKKTPPVYEASALVQVSDAGAGSNDVFSSQALAVSYALQVTNNDVLRKVAQEVPGVSLSNLETAVSASPIDNTQIIQVRADSRDADQAAMIANTVANVFIQNQIAKQTAQAQNTVDNLTKELVVARTNVNDAQAQLTKLVNAQATQDQIVHQKDVVDNYQVNYDALLASYNQVQLQKNTIGNSLILSQSAVPPTTAKGPHTTTNILVAALAGLLLTVAFALFLDWQDSTIKTSEDVAQLALLEPLGSVPLRDPASGTSPANEDVITQAFVTISTNFRILGQEKHSFLVTGLRSGVGISTTASKLAQALAQSGIRVMLIDAHMSRPRQHEMFKISTTRGLTTSLDDVTRLLRQPALLQTLLQQWATNVPNLFLLPASSQGEHVETMQWVSKLRMLTERLLLPQNASSNGKTSPAIDMIIFDAPALDEGVDAIALAPVTDGSLVVVEAGKEFASALHKAQATLQRLGSPIVGVVVNRQQAKHQSYFYAGRPRQAMVPVESSRLSLEPRYPVLQTREFTLQKSPETPMPHFVSQEAESVYGDVTRLDTVSIPNADINTNTIRIQRDSVFKQNPLPLSPSKNNGSWSNDKQGGQ